MNGVRNNVIVLCIEIQVMFFVMYIENYYDTTITMNCQVSHYNYHR